MEKELLNELLSIPVKDAEKTLDLVAKLILQIGIAVSILLLLFGTYYYGVEWDEETAVPLLIASIPTFCFSIISWAILKVFCNISNTLKEINSKITSNQTNIND